VKTRRALYRFLIVPALFVVVSTTSWAIPDTETLAQQVTIHRDQWGVPHLEGPTAVAVTFGLGYAPKTRTDLLDYLINKGFSKEELEEAGLATRLEDGGLIDKFRDRLMFPILNASGKPIAFGGRALNPAARAKYLNSPETPLFHKGDVLYNVAAARAARAASGGQTHPLLVCEGYMDVIALSQAGFPAAVAPLGTALTERQIEMLWTAADEPILCFDGDRAGQAAAYRAVDRALPLLKPGKSLRFAFLPDGLDPDDLIRARGPAAFRAVLEAARSMDAVIWEREAAAAPLSTPERRAGFRSRLRALVARIADPDVRAAYGAAFKHRFNREDEAPASRERWRGSHRTSPSRSSERPAPGPTPELRLAASSLAARQPARMREALIVAAVLNHPELVERFGEEIADLRLQEPRFDHLLRDLIDASLTAERLDSAQARIHLLSRNHAATIDELDADARLRLERFCQGGADIETAEAGVRVVLDQRLLWDVLPAEIEEAKADLAQDLTEAALARLNNLLNHQAALAKTLGCGGG